MPPSTATRTPRSPAEGPWARATALAQYGDRKGDSSFVSAARSAAHRSTA